MKVTHPYSQRNSRNYPLTTKLKPFVGQNLSPKHCNNRYKHQKWTLKNCQANMFPNTTFSICLNLLQFSLSELSFVFAVLFKPPSDFLSGYFNVSLSLVAVSSDSDTFCGTAPLILSMIVFSMLFYIDFIRTTCCLVLSNLCLAQMLTVMWKQQEKILRNTWPFRVNGGWFHVITVLSHIQSVWSK